MISKTHIRIFLLTILAAVMVYAFTLEDHSIFSFSNEVKTEKGPEYVESVEKATLMRYGPEKKIYDNASLRPEAAGLDDCPT